MEAREDHGKPSVGRPRCCLIKCLLMSLCCLPEKNSLLGEVKGVRVKEMKEGQGKWKQNGVKACRIEVRREKER